MPFEGPQAEEASKAHQKIPFINRELNLTRQMLLTFWPTLGTFLWFFYLLAFAASSLVLFAIVPEVEEASDAVIRILALIAVFHLGNLVATYLATLAESAQGEEKEGKYPFAISLQATFVEAVGIAGVLIFIIGKQAIEFIEESRGHINERTLLREIISVFSPESLKSIIENPFHSAFLTTVLLLLLAILWIGHSGFLLLKRRHYQAVVEGAQGKKPIKLDGILGKIAYLLGLKTKTLQKADGELKLAKIAEQNAATAKANIENRISELNKKIDALQTSHQKLEDDDVEFDGLVSEIQSYLTRLKLKLSDPERQAFSAFLSKVLALVSSAIDLIKSAKEQLADSGDSIQKQISGLREELARLSSEADAIQNNTQLHLEEHRRLVDEAGRIDGEVAELHAVAEDVRQANGEKSAYSWLKDSGAKIQEGTFILFCFASLFSVVDDLLLDINRVAPASALHDTFTKAPLFWTIILIVSVGAYWGMKLVYSLGLVGSWRAITTSYTEKGNPQSPPRFVEAVMVMRSNALGALAFMVLFAALSIPIYFHGISASPEIMWHMGGTEFSLNTHTLWQAGFAYHVIPFLLVSALLIVASPIAVYAWERHIRSIDDFSAARTILETSLLILATFVGIAVLTGLGFAAGYAIDNLTGEKEVGPIISDPPLTRPLEASRLECTLVNKLDDGSAVAWQADWSYGQDNQIGDLKQPACTFNFGADGRANYIAIIGTASQEGSPATQEKLAEDRIDAVLEKIDRDSLKKKGITIYTWSLGRHKKINDDMPSSTANQRPLIIISGVADEKDRPAQIETMLKDKIGIKLSNEKSKSDYPWALSDAPVKMTLCSDGSIKEVCKQ